MRNTKLVAVLPTGETKEGAGKIVSSSGFGNRNIRKVGTLHRHKPFRVCLLSPDHVNTSLSVICVLVERKMRQEQKVRAWAGKEQSPSLFTLVSFFARPKGGLAYGNNFKAHSKTEKTRSAITIGRNHLAS